MSDHIETNSDKPPTRRRTAEYNFIGGTHMFKFLFGKKGGKARIEPQRDTVVRTVEELNSVLALMADKPVVRVDLNTGLIIVDLPEQMPDEALALPAPQEDTPDVEAEMDEKAAA